MTDEVHFSLNGEVTTRNCRIRSIDFSHEIIQEDLHPKKAFRAVSQLLLSLDHTFLEEIHNGKPVPVTVSGK